jgi:FemAB-related protein (PEP-CTERM system-associated)
MSSAQATTLGATDSAAGPRLTVAAFDGDPAEWDAFAERQAGYTHYHRYAWGAVMKRVFSHDGVYLAARDETGALAGILPLIRMNSALFGRQLCSMPFLNYGGPIGSDAAIRALSNAAVQQAAQERTKTLEYRSRVQLPIDLPSSSHKITVTMDLKPNDAKGLFKALPSQVRNQVRKPMKAGVTMRFGSDQVRPFFEVFARNMRDLGTPTHTPKLFEKIAAEFPNDAIFGCAYIGEKPVAAGCAIVWGNEIEMVWGSALREYNKTHAPNMMLYWSFMERACELGLCVFNFGRCTPGEGTHRFKSQWGGRDEPLWWYGPHVNDLGKMSAAERYGPLVWRYLPMPIANLIGPWIRRGISA